MQDNTTVERVKALAPHLGREMSDATLQIHIDDAVAEVARISPPAAQKERMQRWLAAHFAAISVKTAASKSVGGMSITYNNNASGPGLDSTPYGQEYKRMLAKSQQGYLRVM